MLASSRESPRRHPGRRYPFGQILKRPRYAPLQLDGAGAPERYRPRAPEWPASLLRLAGRAGGHYDA